MGKQPGRDVNFTQSEGIFPRTSRIVVIHYNEVGLKGKNRPTFIGRLISNIERATRDLGCERVERVSGRLLLPLDGEVPWERIQERLRAIFGVANYSVALRVPTELDRLKQVVASAIEGREFRSFRISARRAFKTLPWTSHQVNEEIGKHVLATHRGGLRVDLTCPEMEVFVELMPQSSYVYLEKIGGPGGLPVGISGEVACLLSGGIDSPVAAYRMMKRGCRVAFVHFHSVPFLSRASQEKAVELVELLTRYQYRSDLFLVPFGEIQRRVILDVPAPFRIVIYRRLMLRIAEVIAGRRGSKALVTGDSLAQVSSQTLDNLAAVEAAACLPVFRPLIGMDKTEISAQAKALGTFEISILPDQDCCQLFIPKNPTTHTTAEELSRIEERLDIEALVQQGVRGAIVKQFSYP